MRIRQITWVASCFLAVGCGTNGDDPSGGDGSVDERDGGVATIDATTTDASHLADGATRDSGKTPDSGSTDGSVSADAGTPPLGRCPNYQPFGNLYWGDLHSHTSYSLDSYTVSNRNDPKDAYAFARGKTLPIAAASGGAGVSATIDRPLDFLAVTDHSEFLSIAGECALGATSRTDDPYCATYRDQGSQGQNALLLQAGIQLARPNPAEPLLCQGSSAREADCVKGARTAWQKEQQAAAAAAVPCEFTSLVGYEWTAQTGTANLHRNVIFGTDAVPDIPIDYLHYPTALALWKALDDQCKSASGCDAITIPHNSNASYGQMWDTADDPESIAYMERYQILTEIFQHKGNSECLPGDALSDPQCDFEIVPGSFLGSLFGIDTGAIAGGGPQGYVRPGLAKGLSYAAIHGDNPLEMGIVGSTDTHNGTPGNVREQGWVGHLGTKDDTAAARIAKNGPFNPGGITGVWARENTRDEIFAALKRRETYATSGPRIVLRFYAVGTANDAAALDDTTAQSLCTDPSFPAALIARGGVPMGAATRSTHAPYLFIHAMKDDTDLDAIDIVKLSSAPSGAVASSVKTIPLVGAGRATSCVYWADPDYAADGRTLYYARVREAPTWRWSHADCATTQGAANGADAGSCGDGTLDRPITERAWSSPVFFKP